MKYPSKTGGDSYVMPLDIYDRQSVGEKWDGGRIILTGQTPIFEFFDTDIVSVSDSTDVRLYIATAEGYKFTTIETDRSKMFSQKFMQSNKDWHNVEITVQFNYTGGNDSGTIMIGARGGLQELPCEGFAYKGIFKLNASGGALSKQQYYPSGNSYKNFSTTKMGTSIKNKFVALKFVICDLDDDGVATLDKTKAVSVKLELYGAASSTSGFKKLAEAVDDGSWNNIAACGGEGTEAGLWGGPLAFIQWGGGADILLKSLTVREIDCTKNFDSTQTGNESFPVTPPAPPNNTTNNESPNDDYGVKKIYQTNANGTHWYPPAAGITSDDRFDDNGADIKNNGDGTYRVTGKSRMLVYSTKIANQRGEDYDFSTYDFSKLQTRGFWDASTDYRDVEVTMYIKCKTLTGTADEFSIVTRSVRHEETDHGGCGGSSYHGSLRFTDGSGRLNKEMRHVDYTGYKTSDQKLGNIIGKKVGLKFICYNTSSTSVRNEVWLDKNADNNWVRYIEYHDTGSWGDAMDDCGALTPGAAITWGSTKIIFKDNGLDIEFSKLSVRSITKTRMEDVTPTTGGSGELSRVFSKYIMLYDVIVDSSGTTCGGPPAAPGYTEVTGLTVTTITDNKQLSGNYSAEDDRKRVGWYCNSSTSKLKGIKPKKIEAYMKKVGSPTGNAEVTIRDSSHNLIVSYGTLDVATLTGSNALKTFTNDNAPNSLPNGILQDWRIWVEYSGGDSSNHITVGVNYNNPVDGTKTCEVQYEREPSPDYHTNKHTSRDMCGKIWT